MFFWPDYTRTNPYQTLLNGASNADYQFRSGDIRAALDRLNEQRRDETVVFHLHWLSGIIRQTDSTSEASAKSGAFLELITLFVNRGGRLVWTIHNVLSHDTAHVEIEARVSQIISEFSSVIHVHGHQALVEAAAVFPIDHKKVVVAEHGSYIGVYPDTISREDARKRLGINDNSVVFTHFGLIRQYKGFDVFLRSLSEVEPRPDVAPVALIAGRPLRVTEEEIRRSADSRLRTIFHLAHIDAPDVQAFMNASDFLVLPYRKVLTSGTAILSMSFGIPVIAPRTGLIPGIVEHGRHGLLYDPADPDGLSRSLAVALAMTPADRTNMGENARLRAESMQWKKTRDLVLKAIVANNNDIPAIRS